MNLINTTYNSSEEMINKLQSLKGKRKLKLYENLSNYYDEIKIRIFTFEDDALSKNAQGVNKFYHETLWLLKFLQTKPQIKNLNMNYYDLYYTVIKNRDDKEIVNDRYEDNENDYVNFKDIVHNHYIGRKINNDMLR